MELVVFFGRFEPVFNDDVSFLLKGVTTYEEVFEGVVVGHSRAKGAKTIRVILVPVSRQVICLISAGKKRSLADTFVRLKYI